ncbi:Beta-glucuronidase-like protein [Sarcoptes scabiei]|uniref:Beta-glucuronidase n=1 Tax=Sarcoptes scabiei TaxID=52283 RepID=A0A132AFS5_SARSC|nr:Beta-glucuronidase-like protein [Sarcoptes scabiei]
MLSFLLRSTSSQKDSLSMQPKSSPTRMIISLDGVWNFRYVNYSLSPNYGFDNDWHIKSLDLIDNNYLRMPVPSSYNDITENRDLRDFVGWVWYDRKFILPDRYLRFDEIAFILRFDSINYEAMIWLNGHFVMKHIGGHIPFQKDVTKFLLFGSHENHLSVAVNNQLGPQTLPQGSYKVKPDPRLPNATFIETFLNFDFFNYAGIQRSVTLNLVPRIRITDINLITEIINNSDGLISFDVITNALNVSAYDLNVKVFDKYGKLISFSKKNFEGEILIKNAHFWWPFTMHEQPGYLYRMSIFLYRDEELLDQYEQMVGIRTITIESDRKRFLINNKPFYFRGFGKHEEYDIRGRSLDPVMIQKDFNLIKWMGANSFRTSHYPYSEQLMNEADSQGIVVIDECPAVALRSFTNSILEQHLSALRDLIDRDKNRPSVVMWSISNEAASNQADSKSYFQRITSEARKFDPSGRPLTAATNHHEIDHLPPLLDVIMLNIYYSWYSDTGYPQIIQNYTVRDFEMLRRRYSKPVMISEYGADTVIGLHSEPPSIFTEDYQTELLIENHRAFDLLREKGWFVGEHIWNFADFMTAQSLTRVGGNKKGIFTRQRQPKTAARLLRCRYWSMANVSYEQNHQKGFQLCPKIIY